jgi:DNA-directed RNA polymerase specialized sigma24 family protein
MNHKSEPIPENAGEILNLSQVSSEIFKAAFSRHHRVLYLIAYRVLFNHGDAGDAMQSFFLSASNNVPQFDCEGSFRSWLLRGLIDEALAILRKNRCRSTSCSGPILDPPNSLPTPDPMCEKAPAHRSDKEAHLSLTS